MGPFSGPGVKLRVAFFGDDFSRKGRGTALVVQKLVEELVTHHPEVEIVLLRPEGECKSIACEKTRSILIPRKFSTMLSYFWFFLTHVGSYDVVVFNRVVYPGFWMLRAKKRILILHDASKSEVYSVPRTFINAFFERVAMLGMNSIDIVIAVSYDAKKWIVKHFGFPEAKVRVLYNAAGPEYRLFSGEEQRLYRKKFSEGPYILDVSRFDPHKNIERVLDAYSLLKEKGAPHALVLVGGAHTPSYSSVIAEQISSSPFKSDTYVLPYVPQEDMPALYACADVLLYPSLVEGFGLPIIEAMKCGTPVVTSSISSMPEISGGAAVLVNPLDARAIADGVQDVLGNAELRTALIEKGIKRASEFSWRKTAEEFFSML